MKNIKQVLAIIGVIILVGMYGLTVFVAIFDPTASMQYLFASIAATILVSFILWLLNLMIKNHKEQKDSKEH